MPIQLFQIFLDRQGEPYIAGEKITGKFVIVVIDSYVHNGIYLKFEGHAIIKWTEESSCFEHTVAKQHRARKQFFDAKFKFASEDTLNEGTHIFPFEYSLPPHLPSSLATPIVTLWYKMEALVVKQPKPRREVLVFPLKGVLDLSTSSSELRLKAMLTEVKSQSMMSFIPPCFCGLHTSSIGLRIGRRGYVPGDEIVVHFAVLTDMHFTFVSLCLLQELTVVTKDKTMIERRTMAKAALADLLPEDSDDYRRWTETLKIPLDAVVSSNAEEYPDIRINYVIKFSAEAIKFPYNAVKISLPITVGSVPLLELGEEDDEDVFEEDNPTIEREHTFGESPSHEEKRRESEEDVIGVTATTTLEEIKETKSHEEEGIPLTEMTPALPCPSTPPPTPTVVVHVEEPQPSQCEEVFVLDEGLLTPKSPRKLLLDTIPKLKKSPRGAVRKASLSPIRIPHGHSQRMRRRRISASETPSPKYCHSSRSLVPRQAFFPPSSSEKKVGGSGPPPPMITISSISTNDEDDNTLDNEDTLCDDEVVSEGPREEVEKEKDETSSSSSSSGSYSIFVHENAPHHHKTSSV